MHKNILPIVLITALFACDTGGKDGPIPSAAKDQAGASATAERDSWQKPDSIFRAMNGVNGKTVADLFADDGYMTFKLIDAGANVIAVETDAAKVEKLLARKRELGLSDERLRVRKVEPGDPGISMEEADMALVMHRITHIQNLRDFLLRTRDGLKAPKQLCVVDFLKVETPVGPPLSERVTDTEGMDLMDQGGFTDVGAYSKLIPYQWVMIAQDFTPNENDTTETAPMPTP